MNKYQNDPNNLILTGDYLKAERIIKKRLEIEPTNHWLITQLASIKYEEKKYSESLRIIKSAHKLAPECPLVNWHYGCILNMLNKHKEAIKIWKKIAKSDVNKIAYEECGEGLPWARSLINDCYFMIGIAYNLLSNRKSALRYLNNHVDNRLKNIKSIYHLKYVKRKIKDIEGGV